MLMGGNVAVDVGKHQLSEAVVGEWVKYCIWYMLTWFVLHHCGTFRQVTAVTIVVQNGSLCFVWVFDVACNFL